ncbi:hypothetical protein ACWEKT_15300 [Nocardia takedensis]
MVSLDTLFSPAEIDCLARTAAELWARTGDPHDILSTRQKELLAAAHSLLTEHDTAENDAPGTAFVITGHDPVPFAIDETAFARWLALHGDHVEALLPSRHDAQPASDLVALFEAACAADVLTEDPRLELLIDHHNAGPAGFTLMLRNYRDEQDSVGLTLGFTEMLFTGPELSTAASARSHLEQILGVANDLLHLITGKAPTVEPPESPTPTTSESAMP